MIGIQESVGYYPTFPGWWNGYIMNLAGAGEHLSFIVPPHRKITQVKGFPMSLFNRILDKLGLRKNQEEEKESTSTGTATAGRTASMPRKPSAGATNPKTTGVRKSTGTGPTSNRGVRSSTPNVAGRRQQSDAAVKQTPAPQAMSRVDVMNLLEQKAKGTGLNWKQSISDLLFLLEIDNSREARTELAKE